MSLKYILFYLLSLVYKSLIAIRNYCYDSNLFNIHSIDCPVISIGNLSIGGTGKTPLTIYLAKILINNGFQPGIISRGYRRISKEEIVVSDGKKIHKDWRLCGDEPFMIAKLLSNVPIIVNNNKVVSSKRLIKDFNVNVILLDDAFQHRKIARDVDIVLYNSTINKKDLCLLPLGILREPIKNISRANIIIATKLNDNINHQFNKGLLSYRKKLFFSINKYHLISYKTNKIINGNNLNNIFAFCGVADPCSFKQGLESMKIYNYKLKTYKDHTSYNDTTINEIISLINLYKSDSIITTDKDVVKLPKYLIIKYKIIILRLEFHLLENQDLLFLNSVLGRFP